MEALITKITEWPVIVQGALGSLLCVAFLYCGEKLIRFFTAKLSNYNKKSKMRALRQEILRLTAASLSDPRDHPKSILCFITLIYAALHYSIKGFLMIAVGSFMDSFVPVFGSVGYVFSFYYFLKAAEAVKDFDDSIDKKDRIEEIQTELRKVEKES